MVIIIHKYSKEELLKELKKGSKAYEEVLQSDKEEYTDDEAFTYMWGKKSNRTTGFGSGLHNNRYTNAGLAEDDLIHSYDNNFGEWR